jgi:hypothetical protein
VPRTALVAGVALVAGIVGYAWWRAGKAGEAPADTTFPGTEQPTDLLPADTSEVSTGGGVSTTGLEFITTNDQWSQKAVALMVDLGFDSVAISQALGKYLANQTVTQTEANWIQAAVALVGKPPIGEHSIRLEPKAPSPTIPGYRYVVQTHEFATRTNARDAVRQYSDNEVETPTRVEVALRATMADPRNVANVRLMRFYHSQKNSGHFPPQSKVYLHVVKKTSSTAAAAVGG